MARLEQEDLDLIINGVADRLQRMLDSRYQLVDAIKSKIIDTPPPSPDIMDIAGVAEYLGVSKRFIEQAIFDRSLPFYKVGRLTKFRRAEVDEHVSRRAFKASRLCQSNDTPESEPKSNFWTFTDDLPDSGYRRLQDMNRKPLPLVEGIADDLATYRDLLRKSAVLRISRRHIRTRTKRH